MFRDIENQAAPAVVHAPEAPALWKRGLIGCAALVGPVAAALIISRPPATDADLLMVVRFMGLIKLGAAWLLAGLLIARLALPVGRAITLAYAAGLFVMAGGAAAIGLRLAAPLGSLAFYAGLAVIVAGARRDHAGWERFWQRLLWRRQAARNSSTN
jgi:hypothetical protein